MYQLSHIKPLIITSVFLNEQKSSNAAARRHVDPLGQSSYFTDHGFGLSLLQGGLSNQCLNKGVGELVYVVSGSDSVSLWLCFIDLLFEFTA